MTPAAIKRVEQAGMIEALHRARDSKLWDVKMAAERASHAEADAPAEIEKARVALVEAAQLHAAYQERMSELKLNREKA
jgi:hypothetical protein